MVLNRQKGVQGTPKGPGTSGDTQVPPGAANTIPKPKSPTHWEMEIIDTANSTNQVQEEAPFITLDAAASTWSKTRRRHRLPFILWSKGPKPNSRYTCPQHTGLKDKSANSAAPTVCIRNGCQLTQGHYNSQNQIPQTQFHLVPLAGRHLNCRAVRDLW